MRVAIIAEKMKPYFLRLNDIKWHGKITLVIHPKSFSLSGTMTTPEKADSQRLEKQLVRTREACVQNRREGFPLGFRIELTSQRTIAFLPHEGTVH